MRLLITTDTVGGVWTFTEELAQGLLGAGCKVALVSVGREPSTSQRQWVSRMYAAFADAFHFASVAAPLEWEQTNDSAFHGACEALAEIVGRFRAELIHSNQFCFGALPASVPVVVTAHSDVLSWAASCRPEPLKETPWLSRYRALVSGGLQGAAAVIAPTRWMLDALASNFALPADRAVIPNGRSLRASAPAPRRLQAVTAGRLWDEGKNISLLANVSSPIPVLVAGETSYENAEPQALPGSATLLGPLAGDALLQLFRETEIYLCTSRYEPFGLAPLEAALCGCAILAHDIPPLREVWADGALFFHDAASLSALLHQLANDRELLVAAQTRSAARAARYTAGAMTAAYLAVFRRHLRSSEPRRAA